jgi:hypothetical protein
MPLSEAIFRGTHQARAQPRNRQNEATIIGVKAIVWILSDHRNISVEAMTRLIWGLMCSLKIGIDG